MIRMPAMPKDLADEIAKLAGDINEQLAFFREMGITHMGGTIRPPRSQSAPRQLSSVEATADGAAVGEPHKIADDQAGERTKALSENRREPGPAPAEGEPATVEVDLFDETVSPVAPARDMRMKTSNESGSTSGEVWNDGSLEEIRNDLGQCTRCRLHEQRTNIVFGEGNPEAELVFVGEGPGADEDRSGRPFVGKAGKLLDKIIEAMGMKRTDVYIANVVKCRPPENRTPERDEAATCGPFLFRQLGFIRPKVIVALGAPALQCLTGSREGITRIRGNWQEWHGIKVMPTYHPAYLLRVPDKKKETWEDMKRVRDYIIKG